jgi:hypothetical protein
LEEKGQALVCADWFHIFSASLAPFAHKISFLSRATA